MSARVRAYYVRGSELGDAPEAPGVSMHEDDPGAALPLGAPGGASHGDSADHASLALEVASHAALGDGLGATPPPANASANAADAPADAPPSAGGKKRRKVNPVRPSFDVALLADGSPDLADRTAVDEINGRYNKNGVCFHKASNKWRAIVYVEKKQVNLGYYPTREECEETVNKARRVGLPKDFVNLRALQQPKRSRHAGVNWDRRLGKWLARVYEPMVGGRKGKEHKVGYFDCDDEAHEAVLTKRKALDIPEAARPGPREKKKPSEKKRPAKGADAEPSPNPAGPQGRLEDTRTLEDTRNDARRDDLDPPENEAEEDNLGAGTVALDRGYRSEDER